MKLKLWYFLLVNGIGNVNSDLAEEDSSNFMKEFLVAIHSAYCFIGLKL